MNEFETMRQETAREIVKKLTEENRGAELENCGKNQVFGAKRKAFFSSDSGDFVGFFPPYSLTPVWEKAYVGEWYQQEFVKAANSGDFSTIAAKADIMVDIEPPEEPEEQD